MNQKITIILSLILIILAIFGISVSLGKNNSTKTYEKPVEVEKEVEFIVYKANEDIDKGTFFDSEFFVEKTIKLKKSEASKSAYVLKDDEQDLNNLIFVKALKKGEILSKNNLIKPQENAENVILKPSANFVSFSFDVENRQYHLIKDIKANDYVDIFFKYEIKNQQKNNFILANKKNDNYSSNKDSANITNLKTFLKHIRVIGYEPKIITLEQSNSKGKTITKNVLLKDSGNLYLELSKDDVKKILVLENAGSFIILPASNLKIDEEITTSDILAKDYIKEFRGRDGAK